jgi:hypothetical protein
MDASEINKALHDEIARLHDRMTELEDRIRRWAEGQGKPLPPRQTEADRPLVDRTGG